MRFKASGPDQFTACDSNSDPDVSDHPIRLDRVAGELLYRRKAAFVPDKGLGAEPVRTSGTAICLFLVQCFRRRNLK